MPISNVYNEDCMEGMTRFPDKFFDLAIVDPPYSEKFNTDACADNMAIKGKYKLNTLNNHLPTNEYWNELRRTSKNQIIWGVNWYNKYFGIGGICWYKDNTGNYSPCELAYQSFDNHIYHFQYRWNGMLQQNMINKENRIHPTQKPIALYKWLLQNYGKPDDKILDTHLGSQSSRIAAYKLGFDFWGWEIDREYFDQGCARFEKAISMPLFDEQPELTQNELFN